MSLSAEQFKKIKPEYNSISGEDLMNAMENYMLQQQSAQEIMKTSMPFFKRYQLRWIFYRRLPNMIFQKGNYTSNKRCKICKKGMGMLWMYQGKMLCAGHEFQEEKNISLKHKLYVAGKFLNNLFWKGLDKIHLVRSAHEGRYDMFGDETKYVSSWGFNIETGEVKFNIKKRKWWEHIFIERKTFNF